MPPCTSLVLLEEVPEPESSLSTIAVHRPLDLNQVCACFCKEDCLTGFFGCTLQGENHHSCKR